jgi:hypothetical protein
MVSDVSVKTYLLSVPERLFRSMAGLGAGVVREVGEVAIPAGVRHSQLYRNLVDATLRFLIEQVGQVDGVYGLEETLTKDFLIRRTAGNALELMGIAAFRVSPVWVLAALADACGVGRHLIPEIADALAADGLIEKDGAFTSVEQILDGLERTSTRLAATFNTPPLDIPTLRKEWAAIRAEVRSIPPGRMPSIETLRELWTQLASESARQHRSIFEMSSILALSAAGRFPDGLRWLSSSSRVAASRTTRLFAVALLDHYRQTLGDIRRVGFGSYALRQFRPYVRAAVGQFSPARRTLTQQLIRSGRSGRSGGSGK